MPSPERLAPGATRPVSVTGTTGSARELVGACLGTHHVYNEISAHAVDSLPSTPLNHFRDSLKGPVNLLTADDERGCDADHPVMRFLAQDSFFLQSLAVGARRAAEFNADPQASAADLFQI